MSTLRITITCELPEEHIEAFRARHDVEGHVLEMLKAVAILGRDVTADMTVETGGGLKLVRKTRASRVKNANGGAADTPEP